MAIIIRPAIEADIPFILQGYQNINSDSPMQTEIKLTAKQIREDILGTPPHAFIDVAMYNDERIGFIFYSTVYFATTGVNAWVTNLYVDPLAARPGLASVGKTLMNHIVIRHKHINGVYAVTERGNHAMKTLTMRYGGKIFENFLFIGGRLEREG